MKKPSRGGSTAESEENMIYIIKISGKEYNDNYTYDTQNDGDLFGEIKEIIEEIKNGNIDTLELSRN